MNLKIHKQSLWVSQEVNEIWRFPSDSHDSAQLVKSSEKVAGSRSLQYSQSSFQFASTIFTCEEFLRLMSHLVLPQAIIAEGNIGAVGLLTPVLLEQNTAVSVDKCTSGIQNTIVSVDKCTSGTEHSSFC